MKADLYYREGSSDKVYHASVEPSGAMFVVNFAYGRRGATLATGTKTQQPVDDCTAKHIFNKLVSEKLAKGYKHMAGEVPDPYAQPEPGAAKAASGYLPQLLNPVDESVVQNLLCSEQYCMQEKFDGRRMMLEKVGNTVRAINKKGQCTGAPANIIRQAESIPHDFVMDGEAVGDVFHAFDVLVCDGRDVGACAYQHRRAELMNLLASEQCPDLRMVETAIGYAAKSGMIDELRWRKAEGVVFKKLGAKYSAGRPNSGGDQFKFKFCATASFIVSKVNTQRSVDLQLFNGDELVDAGSVTIPPNKEVPMFGAIVEVRYLYAYKESGSIYQPVYLGERDDVEPTECKVEQLKWKAE